MSTAEEAITGFVLFSLTATIYSLSLHLYEKRRNKHIQTSSLPEMHYDGKKENTLHSLLFNLSPRIMNSLPIIISVFYGIERIYTENPYIKNEWMINLVAITFGAQFYRLVALLIYSTPDVQREINRMSEYPLVNKLCRSIPLHPSQLAILIPTLLLTSYYINTSITEHPYHWILKDMLAISNCIMLILDLSPSVFRHPLLYVSLSPSFFVQYDIHRI